MHPIREEVLKKFLKKAKADWNTIEKLIKKDKLVEIEYKDRKFYLRKFPKGKLNLYRSKK